MVKQIPPEKKHRYAVGQLGCWNLWFRTCIEELGVIKASEIEEKVEAKWGTFTVELMKKVLGIPTGNDALAFKEHMSVFFEINGVECCSWPVASSEKVVMRMVNCPYFTEWPEEVKENIVLREAGCCEPGCNADIEHRVKTINPRLELTMTKSIPRGDPYCEYLISSKELS